MKSQKTGKIAANWPVHLLTSAVEFATNVAIFHIVTAESFRALLNLGFAKPITCNLVLFTKTTGITKKTKMTKTVQTATSKGVDCWIHGYHGKRVNDENHENPGCKTQVPQNLGLETPDHWTTQKKRTMAKCRKLGVFLPHLSGPMRDNPPYRAMPFEIVSQRGYRTCFALF